MEMLNIERIAFSELFPKAMILKKRGGGRLIKSVTKRGRESFFLNSSALVQMSRGMPRFSWEVWKKEA
jgi:hypothetical protein